MPITALPTPPSRQDPANFPARGDALLGALPAFVSEANALAVAVTALEAAAASSASTAAGNAVAAGASADIAATAQSSASASAIAAASSETSAAASAELAQTSGSAVALAADLASTSSGKGDALVSVKLDAAGSVARTQHDKNTEAASIKDFGAVGDGVANDSAAVDLWLTHLCANGGYGVVPDGTYLLSSGITAALNASVSISVSANAKFVANTGFPAGQRMFLITTGTGTDHVFAWDGGRFDATNQPASGVGESNDIFSFNAENCARCAISLDATTAGADWLTSGSDSHLFIAGAKNVHAWIGRAVGAADAAIYVSSSADGSVGQSLFAGGNFEKCSVGVIVKRLFEVWNMDVSAVDCKAAAAAGSATNGVGAVIAPGNGGMIRVNTLRCERSASLEAVSGAMIDVQAQDIGVSIPGYTSTAAYAAYLSGSSNVIGNIAAQGVNAGCVSGSSFNAVYSDRRTLDATNFDATDNNLTVNCLSVGRGIREEGANCARNHYILHERTPGSASVLSGTDCTLIRTNTSTGSYELDASTVSLGGLRNTEALRVTKTANQVNFVNVSGNVAGSRPSIAAAGTDADIDLQLAAKGTGLLRWGVHAANADAPVTGYITIRDLAGTTRKLAVIA